MPSMGLGYLAACLERVGHPVEILDCQVVPRHLERLLEKAATHDQIGFHVNISTAASAVAQAELIRHNYPHKRILMGGPYASAIAARLIPRWADIVAIGQAERTIAEIVQGKNLSEIDGIAFWENDRVVQTKPREHIEDLDSLPFPAYHLVDLPKYRFFTTKRIIATMITSRGCPFKCINCTKFIHGDIIRYRSPDNVMAEIDRLYHQFDVREIQFWDDNFTLKVDRVKDLCERIIKRGYDLRFDLLNGIRADINDWEMLQLMAKAGFNQIAVAVESGSQEVIDKLGKKLDLSKVQDTCRRIYKLGMKVILYFMIGLPFETRETLQQTIDFSLKLPAHQVHFFMVQPFPGTKLFDMVNQGGGRLFKDLVFGLGSYHRKTPPYEMPHLSAEEVSKLYAKANRRFYLRPIQFYRTSQMTLQDLSIRTILAAGITLTNIILKGTRIT